ncbi:MAG: DUF4388 domain-containing protein [Acidobacteria bacterium]|nr:DUF4388 domain-containing protein [Acidobacteriota bacterium]
MGVLKLEGSLAERDVPELVQLLHERRWTGLMTLSHAGIGKTITVQDGRLVFASSTSPDDRLGELLLRQGRISFKQYVEAGKAVVPGKRLGAILVEQGVLGPKDLVKAVVDHTQEIIYGAFLWTEGHYRLKPGLDSAESITLKMSTPDLILEGIRRIDAWSRVDRGVGGLLAVYARSADYEKILAQMTLSFEKLSLLTALNEPRTVEAICADSSLPDFEVCRTVWAFRVIGVLSRVDAAPAAPKPPVEDEGLGFVLAED